MLETNLHPLIDPGAPGILEYGKADVNLNLVFNNIGGLFYVNGVVYESPVVSVFLQILSGAQEATDLIPKGRVIVLETNKVMELTMVTKSFGAPTSSTHLMSYNQVVPVASTIYILCAWMLSPAVFQVNKWSYSGLQIIPDLGF